MPTKALASGLAASSINFVNRALGLIPLLVASAMRSLWVKGSKSTRGFLLDVIRGKRGKRYLIHSVQMRVYDTHEHCQKELEGLIYALGTVVTVVKIDNKTTARAFPPVQIPASSEDIKAHGKMIAGADKWAVAWEGNIRRNGGKGGRANSLLKTFHKKFKGGYSYVRLDEYIGQ